MIRVREVYQGGYDQGQRGASGRYDQGQGGASGRV